MKLFKTLAAILSAELTAIIVIKKNANGKMTVISNFSTEKGGVCDTLAPFTLKGTPEELDEGFLDAIKTPAETVSGLVSNIEAFQKSAQQAEKNAKAAASKTSSQTSKSISAVDAMKQADEERKRKEAEAKARKENFDKAMSEAKVANAHGNYFTAEALFNFAATLTDDKKEKAEIAKLVKTIAPNKEGFLCNDDETAANAALEAFKNAMVKPQTEEKPAEAPAEAESEAQDAAEAEETSEETAEEETSSDNEDDSDDENNND